MYNIFSWIYLHDYTHLCYNVTPKDCQIDLSVGTTSLEDNWLFFLAFINGKAICQYYCSLLIYEIAFALEAKMKYCKVHDTIHPHACQYYYPWQHTSSHIPKWGPMPSYTPTHTNNRTYDSTQFNQINSRAHDTIHPHLYQY